MDRRLVVAASGFVVLGLAYLAQEMSKRHRRRRRFKVRPINRQRGQLGFYVTTFLPMKRSDRDQFFKYTRMTVETFNKFCDLLRPHFQPHVILPDHVTLQERVAVTLHYLSQGSSMQTIAWKYQLGLTTVHKIIVEICDLVWTVLAPRYLKPPETTQQWLQIAHEFETKWNFPHCIGTMDGKHINIQAPAQSGSLYFNYKKTFSVVLLACADANYKFTCVDIGAYGSQSDGGIFRHSSVGQAFESNILHVPPPSSLPRTNVTLPYVLVADEAFPLRHYIMRPYPGRHLPMDQRIFNYRLSRARRIIENAFGILAARWRILRTTILANIRTIDKIVQAVVCLHNFVKTENEDQYCPQGYVDSGDRRDGMWRHETEGLPSVGGLGANNAQRQTIAIRNAFKEYFNSAEGAVPWQVQRVQDGREPDD